jgi:hypothetical protein
MGEAPMGEAPMGPTKPGGARCTWCGRVGRGCVTRTGARSMTAVAMARNVCIGGGIGVGIGC